MSTGIRDIPLARPYLDEREEELVIEVLRSGRLSLGPTIDRFEELIAERVGAPYAAAVSSGTAGLHLLAHIAGLGPGDEVITSPLSFVSSANCFIFEGATPVFADVDSRTLNMDPAALEAAITERTKAVVPVDMFGYPCELDEIRAICDRRGLVLIEDAAEALGAEYKGRPVGSHGLSGVFGFYPNKQLATGEGGIVFTHSEQEWQLVKSLRNQGRDYRGGAWFHHVRVGFNYRWTDVQAAIGIGQLEKLERLLSLRAEVAARYTQLLEDVEVEPLCADDADAQALLVRLRHRPTRGSRPGSRDGRAARPGHRDGRVRALRPSPAVHARDVRFRRGHVPCRRRGREPDARTSVLSAARGRRIRNAWSRPCERRSPDQGPVRAPCTGGRDESELLREPGQLVVVSPSHSVRDPRRTSATVVPSGRGAGHRYER